VPGPRFLKVTGFLLGCLLVSSCDRAGDSFRAETLVFEEDCAHLTRQIQLARLQTNRGEAFRSELEDAQHLGREAQMKTQLARLQVDTLQREIDHLETSFSEMVAQHQGMLDRTRMKAAGMEIPRLETLSGRHYEEVKVLSVADEGALIKHSSGVARLGVEDLGQDWSERLGLNAARQQEALARREEAEAAYYKRVDLELAALKKSEDILAKAMTRPVSQPLSQPRETRAQPFGFDRKVGLRSIIEAPEPVRQYSVGSYRRSSRRYYRPRVYIRYYSPPHCPSTSAGTRKFTPSTPCR
jgi:hypothetical protein